MFTLVINYNLEVHLKWIFPSKIEISRGIAYCNSNTALFVSLWIPNPKLDFGDSFGTNTKSKNNKVLIIDCHSFPKYPLPYELNQQTDRPEICIGTDSFHTSEKLRIAKLLEKLNVDVIEAGFPIASKGDFEADDEVGVIFTSIKEAIDELNEITQEEL